MDSLNYIIYMGVKYLTAIGEEIYVLGNIPELGNWNIKKGFRLNYHEV